MSLHLLLITSVDIPMVIHHPLESHYQTMDLPAIDVSLCVCVLYMCVYVCNLRWQAHGPLTVCSLTV